MKKIIAFTFVCTTVAFSFAQNQTSKIILTKDQELKYVSVAKTNITQEMMGQTMDITMDITTSQKITVKDVSATDNKVDMVTTHVKGNMSLMGQDKTFDSDNKADMDGEMKDLGKSINVVKALTITSAGKCKVDEAASPEKPDENAMAGMMQQMLGGAAAEEVAAEGYFMLIPAGKKIGDTWTDSVINTATKTYWNYTWDSNAENTAVIKATAKTLTSTSFSTQGMDMTMNSTSDVTEVRKVDIKTGLINSKSNTTKLNGSIDVMGQSVPITGTVTTTITAE